MRRRNGTEEKTSKEDENELRGRLFVLAVYSCRFYVCGNACSYQTLFV